MPNKKSSLGFTLLELLLVIGIVGGVTVTLTLVIRVALVSASETQQEEAAHHTAHHVLNEISHAVRLAVDVHQAGDDLLVVSTRHYFDTDDSIERVRFTLSGTSLLREISRNDGVSYGLAELVNDNVASFSASAFRIADSFDPEDYESGLDSLPTGNTLTADTSEAVTYKVKDLGQIDADVSSSYTAGHLELDPGLLGKWATVSPSVSKDDLSLSVDFTPSQSLAAFTPLLFGSATTGVSVHFDPFGNISVISLSTGLPLAIETVSNAWNAGVKYTVRMRFLGDTAVASVVDGGGVQVVSKSVATASQLTSGPVNLIALSPFKKGIWDNLEIGSDLVTLELGVNTGKENKIFTAKVAPRSW